MRWQLVLCMVVFLVNNAPMAFASFAAKPRRVYIDMVVVGVHSDATAASYKRQPIMSMDERIEVIEACKYVDEVIPNAPAAITAEYIQKNQIDVVVHGHSEEEDEKYRFMYGEAEQLGKFKRTEYTDSISSTDIIKRVIERYFIWDEDAIANRQV